MIEITCPQCGETRLLKHKPRNPSGVCLRCHNASIAHMGWEATKAAYGEKAVVKHLQTYRIAHPSSLEKLIIEQLDALEIKYEREVWFSVKHNQVVYLVDFVIHHKGYKVAIEVNGDWAHQYHAERDRKKVAAISRSMTVIVLSEQEVKAESLKEKLIEIFGEL